ncbi:membrane protein, putative [Oceanicola granulosus HTCC2516]|uniref:Membrane protein, putative n=1 Tax=Oceanicola granulosus (strain ATCC BAA-861 / DSM 15982 / KCTC 12143 / HTCC2516) TaxID=314256 RepID=Q2CD34_OCEGH|nr:MFS transporter [Oceanicola granulosus]EAR50542.1 membrane protein, putative [Oceanicola granulosus HTCC2516]
MIQVLGSAWPLLLGLFMLMVGNGLQGTLLGVRGALEGFSTLEMSVVMSAYFVGFLGGSRLAPEMIRRVGHVRVFAALGSAISAILILYPTLVSPWAWTLGRVIIGFCFAGVYVTAESWLNNSATNETRGQALSLYMIVQMGGIVTAQYLLLLGDAGGFVLFVIPSVLVSLAFAPILLSVSPTPAFATTKPLNLKRLVEASPLASVGMILLGGVFAAQFGMAAVYATRAGMTLAQISVFVSAIYIAGLLFQYPIGWLSDRYDRRLVIIGASLGGGVGALVGATLGGSSFGALLFAAAMMGGTSNPLYSLLIAYANDFLEPEDMAAASAGFIFINGLGAIAGPITVGYMMDLLGAPGYWGFVAVLMLAIAAYGLYRTVRRPHVSTVSETVPYAKVIASASPLAVELAQEVYIEAEAEEAAAVQDEAAAEPWPAPEGQGATREQSDAQSPR